MAEPPFLYQLRLTAYKMSALRCSNLTKSFGGIRALNSISLDLPLEGIVAIIGPNGAGKTTLINVLTGFLKPDEGQCFLGNREITSLHPDQIVRMGVARTFQDLRLALQLPILDNVLLACPNQKGETFLGALLRIGVPEEERSNHRKAMKLLEFAGLEDKAGELASTLSYGQQKLLTLTCCFATEAQILFLDEPVAGVHPDTVPHILGILRQFRHEQKLVVLIEHDISVVRQVADLLIVMDEGKIIAHGNPKDVLEQPEIMEAYIA